MVAWNNLVSKRNTGKASRKIKILLFFFYIYAMTLNPDPMIGGSRTPHSSA